MNPDNYLSNDNIKSNITNVSNNNNDQELKRLRNEINERDNEIKNLNLEIEFMKNKVSSGHHLSKPSLSTPKTSRLNYDPNVTNSRQNHINKSIPPKSDRKEDKSNLKTINTTRIMIRNDKSKAESLQKTKPNENISCLNFLYESLCRIFKTSNHNEIIQKAENMQNEAGLNNDYVKF